MYSKRQRASYAFHEFLELLRKLKLSKFREKTLSDIEFCVKWLNNCFCMRGGHEYSNCWCKRKNK